jgi:hypothetical protein
VNKSELEALLSRSVRLCEEGRELASVTAAVFGRLAETEDALAHALQNRLATASGDRECLEFRLRLARDSADELRRRQGQFDRISASAPIGGVARTTPGSTLIAPLHKGADPD